jgi:anti-sigma regulatory factor (Ser/Thr protein kinase)
MDHFDRNLDLAEAVLADHCHLRIRSLPEWITVTVDHLVGRATQCGAVPPGRANRLTMALHEALTNAIIHGNLGIPSALKDLGDQAFAEAIAARCADPVLASRLVDVQAIYDGQSARWVLTDQGAGFDVEGVLRRLDREDADPSRPSGRGLLIIRAFVDEMRYDEGGRRLTLTVRRSAEKRGQPRIPFVRGVRVTPLGDDGQADEQAAYAALARDISSAGIGMLQGQPVRSGRVLITIPTEEGPISLPATVRHWEQVGDLVEVGCCFEAARLSAPALNKLTVPPGPSATPGPSALGKLVDHLAEQQKPALEQRAAPRLPYTEPITVEVAEHVPLRGFARDLSRTGIAFFTTASLPAEGVWLSLPASNVAPAIHVRAQIVRCTRLTEGFYDVAARFLPS